MYNFGHQHSKRDLHMSTGTWIREIHGLRFGFYYLVVLYRISVEYEEMDRWDCSLESCITDK